jgi:hypothetical protein
VFITTTIVVFIRTPIVVFIRTPVVFRIWMPKRLFKTRTGRVRCGSLSVLDLHFRIAGRIENKEGTLVASFSTLTAQPAKKSTRKRYRISCDGSLARSPNARKVARPRIGRPGKLQLDFLHERMRFFLLHFDRV